jgi:hypothetical protein
MNNEMMMNVSEQKFELVMMQLAKAVRRPLTRLSGYYSRVLERPVDNRQTLLLLNAQLAALMTIFPIDCALSLRVVCGAWLVSALLKCKAAL